MWGFHVYYDTGSHLSTECNARISFWVRYRLTLIHWVQCEDFVLSTIPAKTYLPGFCLDLTLRLYLTVLTYLEQAFVDGWILCTCNSSFLLLCKDFTSRLLFHLSLPSSLPCPSLNQISFLGGAATTSGNVPVAWQGFWGGFCVPVGARVPASHD